MGLVNNMTNDLKSLYIIYNPDSQNRKIVSIDVIPQSLNYNYAPEFAEQSLLGRLSPIYMYRGNSAETYGFTIRLHEDLIIAKGQYKDIVSFVDDLKRFSYPTENGKYPSAYFQLGEIAGFGIVQVTPSWQLPFRNGRYIVVDLSFNVTIEEPIANPTYSIIEEETDIGNVIYNSTYSAGESQESIDSIISSLIIGGADASINDLMRLGHSKEDIVALTQNAYKSFDLVVERLNSVFSAFATADLTGRANDIIAFKENGIIQNLAYDMSTLYTKDNSDAKIISSLKSKFSSYLDFYYKEINRNMTPTERDKIKDQVFFYLEELQRLAEEIYGYGKSN